MKSFALDSNNDILVQNGTFTLVEGAAETVQSVRCRLLMYMGEWFLDTTAGTPYFQEIFIKPANLANIESIFKQRILETDGVTKLNSFFMDYDGGNSRNLSVSFEAETKYGTINLNEVTINV